MNREYGSRSEVGQFGENLAALWYVDHGYSVLERNWRCRSGEIDLIAMSCDRSRHPTLLVFSEVKSRSNSYFGSPGQAVGRTKQRRLRQLASMWIAEHHIHGAAIRFDVVEVVLGPTGSPTVGVIENAF